MIRSTVGSAPLLVLTLLSALPYTPSQCCASRLSCALGCSTVSGLGFSQHPFSMPTTLLTRTRPPDVRVSYLLCVWRRLLGCRARSGCHALTKPHSLPHRAFPLRRCDATEHRHFSVLFPVPASSRHFHPTSTTSTVLPSLA